MHKVRMVLTEISSIEPVGAIKISLSELTESLRRLRRREENAGDALRDQFNRLINAHHYRIFVGSRRFEGRELAVDQTRRHEMALPSGEPLGDQLPRSLQIDEPHLAAVTDDLPTMLPLQRRTGDHAALTATEPAVETLGD